MPQIANGSETDLGNGVMKVTRVSTFSGIERTREMAITPDQLARWRSGALIHRAFPHLSSDDREFLMTGVTSREWDKLWADDYD